MRSTPSTVPTSPDHGVILSRVNRVRRRLWRIRLVERLAFALIVAGFVAMPLVSARLLWDRYLVGAIAVAFLPALAAMWMGFNQTAWNPITPPPYWIRTRVVIVAALSLVAIAFCAAPIFHRVPLWMIPVTIGATFLIFAGVTVRPVTARAAAIFLDQQAGLQERVATALEFLQKSSVSAGSPFEKPVIAAALEACRSLPRDNVGYARAGSRLYASAAFVTVAAAAICFLAPLPVVARSIRRPDVAVIEKGKKLEAILNELEQKKPPANAVVEKKLQPLRDTLADLRKGNMSPFEADARLAEERGDLQKEKDQLDASERVEKALDNIKGLDEVARAGDQVRNATLKNSKGDAANQSAAARADQQMKNASKALGDKMKGGGMSPDDKKKLADALQHAAQQANGDTQLQQDLQKASDAAKQGDGDQLSQNLGAAGQRMGEQRADSQMSGDAVRQAMEAIDRAARDGNGTAPQTADGGGDQQGNPQNGGQNSPQNSDQNGYQGGGPSQARGGQQSARGSSQSGEKNGGTGQQASGQANAGQSTGNPNFSSRGGGGSTNLHAPSGPGDHLQGHPLGGSSDYVKVYDEKAINSQGKMEQLSGKINPLGAASGTQQILGQGDMSDSTIQTYESELPAARKRALDDLQTQQIPPQYRDLIRNYYGQ